MSDDLQQNSTKDSSSQQGPHENLAGKKVDADPGEEKDKPAEENLVTEESQKGKKVDADLELESDQPTEVE